MFSPGSGSQSLVKALTGLHSLWRLWGRTIPSLFLLLVAPAIPRLVAVSFNLFCPHMAFSFACLCQISLCLLLTIRIIQDDICMSRSLAQSHLQRPFFLIRWHFQAPGFGACHLWAAIGSGEVNSSTVFIPLQHLHTHLSTRFYAGVHTQVFPSTLWFPHSRGTRAVTDDQVPITADGLGTVMRECRKIQAAGL